MICNYLFFGSLFIKIYSQAIMYKILTIVLLISVSFGANAQKFGYLNSAEVLSKVPEVALADSLLRMYQDSLVKAGEPLVSAFQKHVQDYQVESQKGNLAPIEAKKKEEELTKEQDTLKALENDVKLKLIQRRETLYNPIIDKIDSLVKKIGKDNNYTMIFDSSQPGYLYLPEGDNLGALVLKELGLQ